MAQSSTSMQSVLGNKGNKGERFQVMYPLLGVILAFQNLCFLLGFYLELSEWP